MLRLRLKCVLQNRRIVTDWISEAWNDIPAQTITTGFRACMLDLRPEDAALEDDIPGFQDDINVVVDQLEQLSMIDHVVGTVRDKDDIVDAAGAGPDDSGCAPEVAIA